MGGLAWMGPRAARAVQGRRGFPYRVIYFARDDLLMIVAVAHTKRRPGYWRERLT